MGQAFADYARAVGIFVDLVEERDLFADDWAVRFEALIGNKYAMRFEQVYVGDE
jgi:hypothetical protein